MEIAPSPSKMSIALTLTSTPPQSSPLTSPLHLSHSQYPPEQTDPQLETQVLNSYALWLQQEIRRLQGRVEDQMEKRVELNRRLSHITQNFEAEVRRGVVDELSRGFNKSSDVKKSSPISGFDCISVNDDSLLPLKHKSSSCSVLYEELYEELYEKKKGCLMHCPATSSSPNSPRGPVRSTRKQRRSSFSHPHKVRFSQHDTIVLFQQTSDNKTRPAGSTDDYRLDMFSASDDDCSSGGDYDAGFVENEIANNPEDLEPNMNHFTLSELTQIAKLEGLI